MNKNLGIAVIGIALVAFLALSLTGFFWGVEGNALNIYYPDEWTHANIALTFVEFDIPFYWQFKFFAVQSAIAGLILGLDNISDLILIGRFISLVYALGIIGLTYFIANKFFSRDTAIISVVLLSMSSLFITFSHMAVPTLAQVFWFYIALISIYFMVEKNNRFYDIAAMIAATISFSTHTNFIPLIAITLVLLLRKEELSQKIYNFVVFVLVGLAIFWLANGSIADFEDIGLSYVGAKAAGLNIIAGKAIWENFLLIPFAIAAGSSLLMLLTSAIGFGQSIYSDFKKKTNTLIKDHFRWYFLLPILIWLGITLGRSTIWPRHLLIFFPIVAIFSAVFILKIINYGKNFKLSKKSDMQAPFALIIGIILIFTMVLPAFVVQQDFQNDSRFEAYDWIDKNIPSDKTILASKYVYTFDPDPNYSSELDFASNPDYIILHEFYYGRYIKKFASGFGKPECIGGVHHPTSLNNCEVIQSLYAGTYPGYELEVKFSDLQTTSINSFEREQFNNFFGMYGITTGEIIIYKKVK